MWERTLQDLIRGLRANKKDESKFISQAVGEIRKEIKNEDMELKAAAVLKLTYLDMLGYDMSWASFNVVEVMSSSKFHLKSVGYLAAVQSFDQDTDVLMLTTNLLKKDLGSRDPADIAVTLNGISHIVTSDLGRDLAPELISMLNHSRAHIRKRAILALYKVMVKYPEALPHSLGRLKEKLEDSDAGVVSATVNVLCELARRSPQDYLSLAPQLFHLLTTSSNNWMLIKIVKLFGSLSPFERRLVKKLQPPITELISTTPAISLLYECVHTCIIGGMLQGDSGDALAKMCVSKLAAFIEDSDQNLKYISLLAMVKIVPSHPHLVAQYQEMILASVNDQDISIRMRALDLISAMVDRDNLQSIVQKLLSHLVPGAPSTLPPTATQSLTQHSSLPPSPRTALPAPSQSPAYRLVLCQRILAICSTSTYSSVTNFEWYLSVLVDLAHIANVDVGGQIRDQLVDVVGRVKGVRRYAVQLMSTLLSDDTVLHNASELGSCSEVLFAAAWICGEYCGELTEPQKLLPYILQPEITTLSPDIVAVYIQAATKIFGHWAAETARRWDDDDLPEVKRVVDTIITHVRDFVTNPHIEVQERASNTLQLFSFIQADLNSHRPRPQPATEYGDVGSSNFVDPAELDEPRFPKSMYLIRPLFSSYELNPAASNAQASVPVPDGLDLDAWIVEPPREPVVVEKKVKSKKGKGKEVNGGSKTTTNGKHRQIEEEVPEIVVETLEERVEWERRKAERRERMRDDPYYIVDPSTQQQQSTHDDDIDSIPVVRLDDMPAMVPEIDPRLRSLREISRQSSPQSFTIDKEGEMPRNARAASVPGTPSTIHTPDRPRTPATPISSFPQYDAADDETRTSTPEPIKVVRTKKKGTGTKKKRTPALNTPP